MSMNATFVQVSSTELARFQRDPSLVEELFQGGTVIPEVFMKLSRTMEDRVRATGPQLAESLARLDPRLGALSGDDLLKLMQERRSRFSAGRQGAQGTRPTLSLDKAWHGVHFLLSGETEPGTALLSQPVLGGTPLGEDDEGFSGYGPARYFTPVQVTELANALNRPGLESEAVARFDPDRMSELEIYPGWQSSDAGWLVDGLRRLRDFYSQAAAGGQAIVTCLV